ncbi:galactose-1-epimerase [Eubacteriales bacterium OttesenSCG-928-K08]|nr:galactose-1-epimerase [Eubacteriales bacterium OttesenSCG-928-K08]
MNKSVIGTFNGQPVYSFQLKNRQNVSVELISLGARVTRILVPDANGKIANVVLGYDNLEGYINDTAYLGATCGRVCNRIRNASFTLDGKIYSLDANDGPHQLHGGPVGFAGRLWQGTPYGNDGVSFQLFSQDNENGYPGDLQVYVVYRLLDDNSLYIEHKVSAKSTKTVASLTNHSYFNLAGHDQGDILGHELSISADFYTPADETRVVTGEVRPVRGTPLDFREAKPVGRDIRENYENLRAFGGYDHNFALNWNEMRLRVAAELKDPKSGRSLLVKTSYPGLQLYTANEAINGLNGAKYASHQGICLEAQYFPNSINIPHFASPVLREWETSQNVTIYQFGFSKHEQRTGTFYMQDRPGTLNKMDIEALLNKVGEDSHQALSELCALAKQKKNSEHIDANINRKKLHMALHYGTPKTRKNAARLIGALGNSDDEATLLEAYKHEQVRLVRPSLLLAIGAVGGKPSVVALQGATVAPAADETEEKHVREETEALRLALAKLAPHVKKHSFIGFQTQYSVFLRAPAGFAPILGEELAEMKIPFQMAGGDTVLCSAPDIPAIMRARTFIEMVFPLAQNVEASPHALAKAVGRDFFNLMHESHEGEPPFNYRVEYVGTGDRAKFVSMLVNGLDSNLGLKNNPFNYEAELRLLQRADGAIDVLCRLFTLEDRRFAYRLHALPASISPVTAACIAMLAKKLSPHALTALDPCCGSGTLLIEWGKRRPGARLDGLDISNAAINAARINTEAAGLNASYITKDCTRYKARFGYDLVLCNLPFGNRVGTHNSNMELYAGFCANLPGWLAKDGIALLYTMEYKLLCMLLDKQPMLKRVGNQRTEAGGLLPHIVIVQRA